ncbi:unnamed protein product [Acanthoscelides obtectus]|uniref:Uncharacterized protein n=1 Tax=Acanthoscelides obtectus TaxID=200917 RepID=A0A9P0NVH4_ACAOB|nr:unnamed protein product [Acanthoscelides obtectus]CAK1639858.1 hypothetical protein AOBTE_LOCUS11418 [Acanthoscelides obtectus]
MTAKRIRNRGCMPYLQTEGVFERAPPIEVQKAEAILCSSWSPFIRLYRHNTLASARKNFLFKPFSEHAPQDQLDFVLSSTFDQSTEFFPDQLDVYLQRETQDIATWRRLRNTRDLTPDREEQASQAQKAGHEEDAEGSAWDSKGKPPKKKLSLSKKGTRPIVKLPYRYNFAQKLLVGGITERRHPSNTKLMNSSHHSPQTNAGYSRQPSDGNFYQY